MKSLMFLSATLIMLLFVNSCKDDEPVKTIPEITTENISDITESSATCNANISDNGGTTVSIRGFVWDTNTDPGLEENLDFSENSSGTGFFSNDLENLNYNTTYYVKAYATNEIGTAYGEELEFTTSDLTWNGISCTDCETVTDIDGNEYRTVSIGDQCWLVENLKTTKLNDGTDLTNITANGEWTNTSIAAYSWYDNDISNKDSHGAIYNYHAVATDKLCPTGWHVATDDEWKVLEGTVDTQYDTQDNVWDDQSWRGYDAGDKLKKRIDWHNNGGGSDDYGFEAIPNGFRNAITGEFERESEWGTVWTHKNTNQTEHFRREFSDHDDNVARYNSNPLSGYAVRCVKDY